MREFKILLSLYQYESTTDRLDNQNDPTFADLFWSDFEETIHKELGITRQELPSLLARLNRTGLYETITGSYINYSGGYGKTTILFNQFVEWVKIKE